MGNDDNKNESIFLTDLQLISTLVFIVGSIVSLIIVYNEKLNLTDREKIFTTKQTLDLSYYNRIVILIAVLISLYVGYKNYESNETGTMGKYKSGLLLSTNILTLISAIIILYVSYLNRNEQTLTVSDVENPLL